MGGGEVIATDLFDRPGFRLARRLIGYEDEVEYHPKIDISQLHTVQRFGEGTFDLAVFCGVLYHLMSPLETLLICRQLLRRNGLLLVGTRYDAGSEAQTLRFNMGEISATGDPTTYFLPTLPALLAMLRTASYNPVAALRTQNSWCGVLAQAVCPSEVRNKTALQQSHDDFLDAHTGVPYKDWFHRLEHGDASPSTIHYAGSEDLEGKINIWAYQPNVPFQPHNPFAA